MRRLIFLASAMIFLDVAFFAAVAPLLPDYVDELGLSKGEAGILSAAYAAGTLIASLPAGLLASRVGPRRCVIVGLLILGVASLVFGLVDQIVLLDAARFVQGVAGALLIADESPPVALRHGTLRIPRAGGGEIDCIPAEIRELCELVAFSARSDG